MTSSVTQVVYGQGLSRSRRVLRADNSSISDHWIPTYGDPYRCWGTQCLGTWEGVRVSLERINNYRFPVQWCVTVTSAQGGGGVSICRVFKIWQDRGTANQMSVCHSPASGRRSCEPHSHQDPFQAGISVILQDCSNPHMVPAWQRCSAHIPFPLIASSTLQTAAKEKVSLHLSPSNQVLGAYMELVRHNLGLGWQKGRHQELCNIFVEILGFASEKRSNSSSQLKRGLVQKVEVMRGLIMDLIMPGLHMCFASQNILVKCRIQPLGIQYHCSDLPCPWAVHACEAAEFFHIRMLTEESWQIFLQQCKLWLWVPVWHLCCSFISLPRAELEGRGTCREPNFISEQFSSSATLTFLKI